MTMTKWSPPTLFACIYLVVSLVLFWDWQLIFSPECIFIREGQRVQESSVQQHKLVIEPSDLQWSKRREMEGEVSGVNFYVDGKDDNSMSVYVCLCSYVSFARSEARIVWSK